MSYECGHQRVGTDTSSAASQEGARRSLYPPIEDVTRKSPLDAVILERPQVKIGLVDASEANAINFIGAAVKASNVEGEGPRIFMGSIRNKLRSNINQGDEDWALAALRRYRLNDPDRFRIAA
jgi:hypothetical protein